MKGFALMVMNFLGSSILRELYCWKDKTRKCVVILNSYVSWQMWICWQHHRSLSWSYQCFFCWFWIGVISMCWRTVLLFTHSVFHIFLDLIKSKTGPCWLSWESVLGMIVNIAIWIGINPSYPHKKNLNW